MIAYAARTGTRRNLAALRAAGWRLMLSPRGVMNAHGFSYALDNGAWTAFTHGESMLDIDKFERACRTHGHAADWVVAPDIVMGGRASLDLSFGWLPHLRRKGFRVAIAVQNGHEPDDIGHALTSDVGIFVGGDAEWKERTATMWCRLARRHGSWCHVARVNTARRLHICAEAGATSFDGSSASRYSKTLPLLDAARRVLSLMPLMDAGQA